MNVTTLHKPTESKSRMSLNATRDGIQKSPMRILIFAPEKVGKSTFASGAPSPIWLGADAGTDHLNVRRFPQPETFKEVLEAVHEVTVNGRKAGIETLVIDPLNWFEALVISDVVGDSGKSLAEYGGGFGKGAAASMDRWRQLKVALEQAWTSGMHIVMCAHAHVKKFEDPEGPGYERWELAMSKEPAGLFKQWSDAILFARSDNFGKMDPTSRKVKANGSSARFIYTQPNPAYDAGNRWKLPPELPLSWTAFMEAKTRIEGLLSQIESGLRQLNDSEVERKVRDWLIDPSVDVAEVANAVSEKVKGKAQ